MDTNFSSLECPSCKKALSQNATFCGECGTQVKCIDCKEELPFGNKFCELCGTQVGRKTNAEAPNTITFQETSDGRSIKAEFTDPVAKDVTSAIGGFLANKSLGTSPYEKITMANDKISNTIDIDTEDVTEKESKLSPNVPETDSKVPDIKNLVYRRLPRSESEWLLIYSCYSTAFQLDPVNHQTLKDYYGSTGRKTDSNIRNIKTNMKSLINGGYIEFINDEEFVVTEEGFLKAKEIIQRTSGASEKSKGGRPKGKSAKRSAQNNSKSSKPRTSSKSASKSISMEKFDTFNAKKSLKQLFDDKKPSGTSSRILLIAYYICLINENSVFSEGNIDYGYRHLKLDNRPKHLRQTINNAKNDYLWFEDGDTKGNWTLTRDGELKVEEMG